MAIPSFNEAVAARTRTASHILSAPDLLAGYQAHGGRSTRPSRTRALSPSAGSHTCRGQLSTVGVLVDLGVDLDRNGDVDVDRDEAL